MIKIIKNFFLVSLFISNTTFAACVQPSDLEVISWSYQVMMATRNINVENYKENLAAAKEYYTKKAWSAYDDQLKSNGTIDKITQNNLTVMVGLQSSPLITDKKDTSWVVTLPLLVNYESTGSYNTERENIKLNIINNKSCQLKVSQMEIS